MVRIASARVSATRQKATRLLDATVTQAFTKRIKAAATLSPAEQQAMVGLTADQRQQYLQVASRLDERARAQLEQLLASGKLNGGRDLQMKGDLLGNLAGLATGPLGPGIDRRAVLSEAVRAVADPASISQGSALTCGAATVQAMLARQNPAEYVRILAGLSSQCGRVTLSSGQTIVRGASWDQADIPGTGNKLLQTAFMGHAAGGYDAANDLRADGRQGLYADEVAYLQENVLGKAVSTLEGNSDDVMAKIGAQANSGKPVSVLVALPSNAGTDAIKTGDGQPAPHGGGHYVQVTSVKAGKLTYIDPRDGKARTVDASEFQRSVRAANVDAAPGARIRRKRPTRHKGILGGGCGTVVKAIGGAISGAAKAVGGAIAGAAKAVGGAVVKGAKAVGGAVSKAAKATVKTLGWVGGHVVSAAKAVGRTVAKVATAAAKGVAKVPTTVAKAVAKGVAKVAKAVAKAAKAVAKAATFVADKVGDAAKAVWNTAKKAAEWVGKVAPKVWSVLKWVSLATPFAPLTLAVDKDLRDKVWSGIKKAGKAVGEFWDKYGNYVILAAQVISMVVPGMQGVALALAAYQAIQGGMNLAKGIKNGDWRQAVMGGIGMVAAFAGGAGALGAKVVGQGVMTAANIAGKVSQVAGNGMVALQAYEQKNWGTLLAAGAGMAAAGAGIVSQKAGDVAGKWANYANKTNGVYQGVKNKDYEGIAGNAVQLAGAVGGNELGLNSKVAKGIDKAGGGVIVGGKVRHGVQNAGDKYGWGAVAAAGAGAAVLGGAGYLALGKDGREQFGNAIDEFGKGNYDNAQKNTAGAVGGTGGDILGGLVRGAGYAKDVLDAKSKADALHKGSRAGNVDFNGVNDNQNRINRTANGFGQWVGLGKAG